MAYYGQASSWLDMGRVDDKNIVAAILTIPVVLRMSSVKITTILRVYAKLKRRLDEDETDKNRD